MKTLGIIPARFGSTRFPGKPLAEIQGKSMIRRVYEQCLRSDSLTEVYVATDNQEIFDHVDNFGGNVILTSERHRSGTERCREAVEKITSESWDAVINIQGDEPFISPDQIKLLVNAFRDPEVNIATLGKKITADEEIDNPNVVKVVFDLSGKALYFSRCPIPYRTESSSGVKSSGLHFKHIGIYGYRINILKKITELDEHMLEKAESLEQLRWLAHGFVIHVIQTDIESVSVDTPEDLLKFTNRT